MRRRLCDYYIICSVTAIHQPTIGFRDICKKKNINEKINKHPIDVDQTVKC